LLTGWQLQEAKRQTDLSELEREFVDTSAEEVDRVQRQREEALRREADQARALAQSERRLRRRTLSALIIVLVALGAICVAAAYFWVEAQRQESIAREQHRAAEVLMRRDAEQKVAFDRLKYEYDQLFAKQVRQAIAPESRLPSSQPVTIYLHISEEGQRDRAREIAQELVRNNIKVPGIQRVSIALRSTQVRYFRQEDRRGAEEIKRLLSEYLGVRDIELQPIRGFEQKVPLRQYEIWFAPDVFGSEAKKRAG